jgi:protein-lysine N-methyltransferase EEF2KMT
VARLAELLTRHIPLASEAAQQKCYVTYTGPSSASVCPEFTLLEARSLLASSGTTGFRTWEAALFLGTFLSSSDGLDLIKGRTILELGAGTGFLSILCAKQLGARYVLSTDGSAEVVHDLESNIILNGLDKSNLISTAVLKWGHILCTDLFKGLEEGASYNLVLGADVVSLVF